MQWTYRQAIDYLYTHLPLFQRVGSAAYHPTLSNTIALCKLLSNPQETFKSIHIAGTNGKGSVSHLLASILQEAGYCTGLYTSPHLIDFRERIKVNGKMISKKAVSDFTKRHKKDFEKIAPSFFEMTVALAFEYFRKKKVDVAVIETGLGGRLDATNILTPVLSVITNISSDHQQLLGNTLQKIAAEKAGIIKPGIPVVIGETQKNIRHIFLDTAQHKQAAIAFADKLYEVKNKKSLTGAQSFLQLDVARNKTLFLRKLICELPGFYQSKNIITALAAIEQLTQQGFRISTDDIKKGMAHVVGNTGLGGRWQTLSINPLTVADTGHNEAGIKEVCAQIKSTTHRRLHFVLGMVCDKDIKKMLHILPRKADYYFCKASIPRGLDASLLAAQADAAGLKGTTYPSVKAAVDAAFFNAGKKDLICIGGSTFVVGEALAMPRFKK